MKQQTLIRTCAALAAAFTLHVNAETIVPAQGQSQEQVQADAAQCQAQAKSV